MNYYLDTEFIDHRKQAKVMGFHVGKPVDTTELISIGIVAEDGREYYAISNEFDLDAAWADTWVRFNVLALVHKELCEKQPTYAKAYHYDLFEPFTKKSLRHLLKWHGRSRAQIRNEVVAFAGLNPVFHGYFCDYDWVVFCHLFGRMIDLPSGYPMYCRDLKQIMDDQGRSAEWKETFCADPIGEHNALVDARWNKRLHEKLVTIP